MTPQVTKEPKFEEPNLHVVQIHQCGEWMDYSSVKNAMDMKLAIMNVKNGEQRLRIVKRHMGNTVVYYPSNSYGY